MEPVAAVRVAVDEVFLARHLPDTSYADAFAAQAAGTPTAREWAVRTLDSGSKLVTATFRQAIWHGVLGFDLAAADAPQALVGWRITTDEPDLFVLESDGRLMEGRMIFVTEGPKVTWTTAVSYHSRAAKVIWAGAQNVHRLLARRLLTHAARVAKDRANV